jgi:hypothetical protein
MGLIALYYHVFSLAYKLYQRYFLTVRWMDARDHKRAISCETTCGRNYQIPVRTRPCPM